MVADFLPYKKDDMPQWLESSTSILSLTEMVYRKEVGFRINIFKLETISNNLVLSRNEIQIGM